jgi:uncharacterized protein
MKTLILGASTNPSRYSNKAALSLLRHKHEIVLVGRDTGNIEGLSIKPNFEEIGDIHTVTLYINPSLQQNYTESLLKLNPKRVIFNPGTENQELKTKLDEAGIETIEACTLVILATNQY